MGSSVGNDLADSFPPAPWDPLQSPGVPRRANSGSLRDFLSILFRHFWLVTVIFSATVFGTCLWMMIQPDKFEVTAKVMLMFAREAADPRTSLSPITTRVLPASRPDINTEAELIKSYAIIEQVVVNLGLDKPVARPVPSGFLPRAKYELKRISRSLKESWNDLQIAVGLKERLSPREIAIVNLIQGLKVESVRDSSVVKVTLTTSQREGAAKTLNALLDLYRERRLAVEKNTREIVFFSGQATQSRRELFNLESRLNEMKQKFDLSSVPDQIALALHDVSETERAVNDLQSQIAASEAKLRALEAQIEKEPKSRIVNETNSRNAELDVLLQRRDSLELERQKALGKFGDGHPEIKSLDEQLDRIQKQIAGTQTSVPQSRSSALNTTYLDLEKELLTTHQTLGAQRAQLQARAAALNEYRSRLGTLRDSQSAHNQLSRDVAIGEETYKLNERNAMEARAAEVLRSHGVTSIEVVDPAADPILPSGISKSYLLGGSLLVGLILALGAALLTDSLDHAVHSPEDVERHIGLPIVGCISHAKADSLVIPPQGKYIQQFGQLAALVDRRTAGAVRSIAVCGASARCRPDLVAAGLAHTFGPAFGRRALLVGVEHAFDECAGLYGKLAEAGSRRPLAISNSLQIVPLAATNAAGGDLDLAERIGSLAAAYPDHDRISVDLGSTPPETWVAAASQATAGVLLVVEAESTRREVLERWEHVARTQDFHFLGAVLNGRRYPIPGWIYRWWL